MLRSIEALPKQGSRTPWRLHQNHLRDVPLLRYGSVADAAMEFSRNGHASEPAAHAAREAVLVGG